MSHVVTIQTQILDLEALRKACQRLGWKFHEGKTKHVWAGHWYDDSPVPRNLFLTEAEYQEVLSMPKAARQRKMKTLLDNCQHVISIPGYNYEIGVFKVGNRYELSYDWVGDITKELGYPEEYAKKHGLNNPVNPLPQAYGLEKTKISFEEMGWDYNEWKDEQGNIYVEALTS